MAKLTKKEVLHVAKLSKLSLKDKDIDKFSTQLSNILEYINLLNEVDVTNVEPTAQTTGLTNVFRKDEIDETKCLPQEGFFEVAQILHKND